ncbi:uncharacterized protein Z518_03630 [Rhinocladiella mackenziei CBS 650.93]|uniref:Uncharacterized protein n=1 Tax=Rhinocladiella mackenziei CBS 650.93 TaxID=1442369 RepID=A0A0D2H5G7_9EURO|nr:uncharacterized protein Z518_03630 [Rhinocladiella mackenziei CBS 650.93]KIX05658.1 hypothetical protein Z518_03630 [Rhinocladiella mackenziei CBS 650.93]
MATGIENVALPVDLTAFVLAPDLCNTDKTSRIGPITQPNYVGLRLDEALMRHDLVDHVDFHLTQPADKNPRLTDIGANPPELRLNRVGVYLHWSLPRCYRSGKISGDNVPDTPPDEEQPDSSSPSFPVVPNRWLIVRRLASQESDDGTVLPEFQTWIIESNRKRKVQDIPDSVDLEVDTTPFVADDPTGDQDRILEAQAEVFIGQRHQYSGWGSGNSAWNEQESSTNSPNFIDLTVLGSSNPLFPDYVPHNASAFSLVDSFAYLAGDGETKHLVSAEADYFVIGWHSLSQNDPLATRPENLPLSVSLSNLKLGLDLDKLGDVSDEEKAHIQEILASELPTRALLHGSVYSVKYSMDPAKYATKSMAEEAAAKFTKDFTMEPLSAGLTPLDGIITFLRAHEKEHIDIIIGDGAGEAASYILNIADLLYAADDSYNERVKAQDLNLYEGHFAGSTFSGHQWDFAEKTTTAQPPKEATDEQVTDLAELNEKQSILDAAERKLKQRRWDLFSEWWKYVSDKSNINESKEAEFKQRVQALQADISGTAHGLEPLLASLRARIAELSGGSTGEANDSLYKRTKLPSFYTRKEPTICVAGVDSGWPADFMDRLQVRLDSQFKSDETNVRGRIFGNAANPLPAAIKSTAEKILGVCLSKIRSSNNLDPIYEKGFQDWGNTNPFSPLFVEWEAIYYHIDRSKWTVDVRPSPVGLPHSLVRYGVSELLAENDENQRDFRYISGRVMILPQPIFSLQSAVASVLDSNDPDMDLTEEEIQVIKDHIGKFKFISCPLTGIAHHLLTRSLGTHVKPTMTRQGRTTTGLREAVSVSRPIGFEDVQKIGLINTESDLTPYGNLLNFATETYPQVPFKGVRHGQLMLVKLNIVDKFGQAIALPPPKPKLRVPELPPPSVHPCLSDFLMPDILDGTINTVYPEPVQSDGDWPLSRFMQIPPAINQDARINATFLTPIADFPHWKETDLDAQESPIFGWIVINYQNLGLQFFRPDGRFYLEVRIGGPEGTNVGSKWLPFDPPSTVDTGSPQLDELISRMRDAEFLLSFSYMINSAIKTMPYPPSDYSEYANSIVGKPLALVNVGWSLELAIPPLTAQNTLGNRPTDEAGDLLSYNFPLKIGDADRPFDGVLGYFRSNNITQDHTPDVNPGRTDWSTLYTYFPDPAAPAGDVLDITAARFPTLSPTYVNPVTRSDGSFEALNSDETISTTPFPSYTAARTAQSRIATLLIDPYAPVHAYSPILPVKALQLPPWSIQRAMTRMTAFFRLGPLLLSRDVPHAYDADRPLDVDSLAAQLPDDVPPVRIPVSGKKGLWRWLQPYDVEQPGGVGATDAAMVSRFNALNVEEEDTRIRKDAAPYTFVEGYLQLARPLLNSEVRGMV